MVLADTNIFIDFLRGRENSATFARHLENGEVLLHPFVEGELYLSGIPNEVKELLGALPKAPIISHETLLAFIERYQDKIRKVGYVDLHLFLAAAHENARLLTRDSGLLRLDEELSHD